VGEDDTVVVTQRHDISLSKKKKRAMFDKGVNCNLAAPLVDMKHTLSRTAGHNLPHFGYIVVSVLYVRKDRGATARCLFGI